MSFTRKERTLIDIGFPCPMGWATALVYTELLLDRRLTYDEAIEVLGFRPDVDHPHVRTWLSQRGAS